MRLPFSSVSDVMGEFAGTTMAVHSALVVTPMTWTGAPFARPSSAAEPAVCPNSMLPPRKNSSALLLPWLSTQLILTFGPSVSWRIPRSFRIRLTGS